MIFKNKTLLFISTHLINQAIILEYKKMLNIKGCDAILVIDNTNLNYQTTSPIVNLEFFREKVKCFLFDENLNKSLKLPMLAAHKENPDFKDVMWANADYRFYYVKKFFPNYDYYWQFDYDVFCNGKSYKSFLEKYNNKKDDLIICAYRKEHHNGDWMWTEKIDWLYKDVQLYGSFFPACRMSNRAISFLYNKRLKHKTLYKNKDFNTSVWPLCELFVATELSNNGFICSTIADRANISLKQINLNQERIFIYPDNKLYHAVKTEHDDKTIFIKKTKKDSILKKIFSVRNTYRNNKKHKLIYLLFFKITL